MTLAATPATSWEGRPVAAWRQLWRVPELHVFPSVGSTNDIARQAAERGAPAGTVVIADVQTAGRGQAGRRWVAAPADGLLLSMVFRPAPPPATSDSGRDFLVPGTAPLRVGLAAAAAIDTLTGSPTGLKWPNDLFHRRHGKLGGILCEAFSTGDEWVVVAGIGINVRTPRDGWPAELPTAAALDEVAGRPLDRPDLATPLLARLLPIATQPLRPLDATELAAFARRDVLRGRTVIHSRDVAGSRLRGTAAGVDADGALLIEVGNTMHRVTSGSVRPVATAEPAADSTAQP